MVKLMEDSSNLKDSRRFYETTAAGDGGECFSVSGETLVVGVTGIEPVTPRV